MSTKVVVGSEIGQLKMKENLTSGFAKVMSVILMSFRKNMGILG